jgi:hypothetical protein
MQRVVASDDPLPAAIARQMMWRMPGADHPMEAHKIDSRGIFHMGRSPDVADGIAAFDEKRAPRFGMRVSRDMPPYYPVEGEGVRVEEPLAGFSARRFLHTPDDGRKA